MRPGERGRQPQTERGSGGGPSPSAEAGASQSRRRRVPGCASGESAPGPDQDGKEKHSRSQGLLEFLGVVFGPPGSAGHSAPTPPESALPEAPAAQRAVTQRRSRPGKSKADPRLQLVVFGRAAPGLDWGPGRGRRFGASRGARTYLFLALGRAGYPGCGPAWHSPAQPRASSTSAQRQGARGQGCVGCHILRAAGASRLPGSGARRIGAPATRLLAARAPPAKAEGSGASRRSNPRSAAAPSGFSFLLLLLQPRAPCASPRSLNDAQVPPGAALFISLPSPKRDSPSTTSPCLQSLRFSAGGLGWKN